MFSMILSDTSSLTYFVNSTLASACFEIMAHNSQAGATAPSCQTLTKWKKAVFGLSKEAFAAVGEVYNSRDTRIDVSAVSLNFLLRKAFIDMRDEPNAQALAVHIIARYGICRVASSYTLRKSWFDGHATK